MKILLKIIVLLIFFPIIDLQKIYAEEKISIGLLIPLSGEHKEIGKSIMLSVRLALNKIDTSKLAENLLEYGVAIAPGNAFGDYKHFFRISACGETEKIVEGMDILKARINDM